MGQRPKSHPNVIIITAIPSDPCQFPIADYMNKLSIANKQDYAHRHSFELHFASEVIDPNVTAVRTFRQLFPFQFQASHKNSKQCFRKL